MRSLFSNGFLGPPTLFIVLCLLGASVTPIWRRTGIMVVLVSSLCLFVAATPAFSSYLLVCLEAEIPEGTDLGSAQAIVVLGADVRSGHGVAPDTLGPQSIERLLLAADAYHRLHLPVAVSGGRISDSQTSVAELMKSVLERYFAVPVAWSEDRSRTTYENALYTAQQLRQSNIGIVIIITQAHDLPRAIWSFERVGVRAIPWPAPVTVLQVDRIEDFLPNAGSLYESFFGFHEFIGSLFYRLRY